MLYDVHTHSLGRPIVKNGPMAGCRNFLTHKWVIITPKPVSKEAAIEIANLQPFHAVVGVHHSAEKVFDNGKMPQSLD